MQRQQVLTSVQISDAWSRETPLLTCYAQNAASPCVISYH